MKKYTKETYLKRFNEANIALSVEAIIDEFTTVDNPILVKCNHGTRAVLGWQALKLKHCCRKGYYESGTMWKSRKKSVGDWQAELTEIFGDLYILTNLRKVAGKEKLVFECKLHKEVEQWNSSLKKGKGCPLCIKEKEYKRKQLQAKKNFIKTGAYLKGHANISKAETVWLNELKVPARQHLLEETGQTVDGFDKDTNTVYLYHGRYWHGCPDTYDPEEIHPSVGVKMKQLYKATLDYEQKIRDAGYELIVKWG